ncbi:MAG: energy transducer TonB [Polyangia bacterium]|jgi:protein TonB
MPVVSAVSVLRRRYFVSLFTSAICHTLLFGLGAVFLTRSLQKQAAAENVVVDLVEAKLDPIRDVPPARLNEPPVPLIPVKTRTSVARMRPKSPAPPRPDPPAIANSPSTDVSPDGEVALPVAAETALLKGTKGQTSGLPIAPAAPTAAGPGPGPITVLATPRYRSNPPPEYPIASRRRHEEGVVETTVAVSRDGRALRVSLLKSSGHPLLDQAAIDAVRGWTFEPAQASGVPVASKVVVPVRFSLSQQ